MNPLTRREFLVRSAPVLASAGLAVPAVSAATPPLSTADTVRAALSWPERRKQIERAWLDLLGEFPTGVPALQPVMREVARENGTTRYHVSFQSEADDRVTAWLLVPDRAHTRPVPAIICLHSTTFGSGKDSTVGLAGMRPSQPPEQWAEFYRNPEVGQAYGRDLAQHGYVTLSIDFLTDGERIRPGERLMDTRGFYARHPEWSMIGKNVWDIRRSVDFLQTLDFVARDQIGCIGWSLGGHTAVFAAAFEPRLAATVSNGGVLDWHRPGNAWARPDDMTNSAELIRRLGYNPQSGPYIYVRKFRPYVADPKKPVPVDFDGLMMLVAPRPQLIVSSEWEFYSHKLAPKRVETMKVYADWRDVDGTAQGGRRPKGAPRVRSDARLLPGPQSRSRGPDTRHARAGRLGCGVHDLARRHAVRPDVPAVVHPAGTRWAGVARAGNAAVERRRADGRA